MKKATSATRVSLSVFTEVSKMASASVRTATVASDVLLRVETLALAPLKELVTVVLRVDGVNTALNRDVLACTTLTAVGTVNV